MTLGAVGMGSLSAATASAAPAAAANGGTTFSELSGQDLYPCGGLCVLSPTGTSVDLSGAGNIFLGAPGMMVDSSSSPAISLSGEGNIFAPHTAVTGPVATSVRQTGQGSISENQGGGASADVQPSTDPLRGLSDVAVPRLSGPVRSVELIGRQSRTIRPGIYSDIEATGSGQLTLEPGAYVVTRQFAMIGDASVTGIGVTLYFACASYPVPCKSGQRGASLDLTGRGLLELVPPPTNASCVGLSVVFDPNNASAIGVTGSGEVNSSAGLPAIAEIQGIVYAPKAALELSGGGSMLIGEVVVDSLGITGSGGLLIAPAFLSADVCSLQFDPSHEPTTQIADASIAGGPTGEYLPASTSPIEVDAVDPNGNLITSYDGPVTLSLASGTGTVGASLAGNATVDAVNGVASFPGLSVDAPGGAYQLVASAPIFNPGPSSGDFDIYGGVSECAADGGSCSASTTECVLPDGTCGGLPPPATVASATISYVDDTSDPEYVLVSASPSLPYGPCPENSNGPSGVVGSAIYDATTGEQDVTSVATLDETIDAPFVQPPPLNPFTGVAAYVVCFASNTPFEADPYYGPVGETVDGETLEIGVLGICGAVVPTAENTPGFMPAPPPFEGPPFFPAPPAVFSNPNYEPPCTDYDTLDTDPSSPDYGSVSAQWQTVGDPAGRDG